MRKNDRRAIELRDLAVIVVKARGSFVERQSEAGWGVDGGRSLDSNLHHFADDHIRIAHRLAGEDMPHGLEFGA